MFQVSEASLGTPNAQTHPRRCSRTRLAMSSRSAAVQSACGPRTASSSIFSSVSMLPPNSCGSSLSSLATSPPRTRSTGEPDCASSKISVNRDGASSRKIFFTVAVWQPCTNNSSRLARVRWNAFECARVCQAGGQEKPTEGNEENEDFPSPITIFVSNSRLFACLVGRLLTRALRLLTSPPNCRLPTLNSRRDFPPFHTGKASVLSGSCEVFSSGFFGLEVARFPAEIQPARDALCFDHVLHSVLHRLGSVDGDHSYHSSFRKTAGDVKAPRRR